MTLTQIIKRIYKSSKQTVDACSMVHVLVAVFVRRHAINIDRFPNLISAVAAADTILVYNPCKQSRRTAFCTWRDYFSA